MEFGFPMDEDAQCHAVEHVVSIPCNICSVACINHSVSVSAAVGKDGGPTTYGVDRIQDHWSDTNCEMVSVV